MKQSMATLTSQDTDEWYTPSDYIELVRDVLWGIDLDPASADAANGIVKAKRFFTKEQDGLSMPWEAKSVFCNPPYVGNGATVWSREMQRRYLAGEFEHGIMLCFAKLGYNWFNSLLMNNPVCLAYHRIPFIDPVTMLPKMDYSGKPVAAKHGSAFVYFGRDPHRFLLKFSKIGKVVS